MRKSEEAMMQRIKVTKDMTEKDIMKVWVGDDWGSTKEQYTDEVWRAECEQRSLNLKQKAREAVKANQKQIGGDHYKNMGVEPWDVVDTWPIEQQIGAHRKDALKYLMRLYDKDTPLDNAAKALHCIEKLIEVLENENAM